jgi:hypothetical protein
MKGLNLSLYTFIGQFIMTQNSWNYSVQTTRQAFYLMLEKDSDSIADIFDLIFSELTIEQLESINKRIDAPIFKELFLMEKK